MNILLAGPYDATTFVNYLLLNVAISMNVQGLISPTFYMQLLCQ